MYKQQFFHEDVQQRKIWFVIVSFCLSVGVVLGSVYLEKMGQADSVKTYLGTFFTGLLQTSNNWTVFQNTLREYGILFVAVFLAGFFKPGWILTLAMVLKKGFVVGFTSASLLKSYGIKGILGIVSTMPGILIALPALIIFSAVSLNFSINPEKKEKNMLVSYLFFSILMLAIFCMASLAEGYLTTTFMKMLLPKIL